MVMDGNGYCIYVADINSTLHIDSNILFSCVEIIKLFAMRFKHYNDKLIIFFCFGKAHPDPPTSCSSYSYSCSSSSCVRLCCGCLSCRPSPVVVAPS